VFAKSHPVIELLTARLRQSSPDDTQNDLRLVELLTTLRVKKRWESLARERRRHVYSEAIDCSEGLETESRNLVAGVAI
jgi:hypothetical protein